MSVRPIPLDSVNHDLDLVFLQEELGLRGVFGEVDQEDVSEDGDDDRDDAFPDEDPGPVRIRIVNRC